MKEQLAHASNIDKLKIEIYLKDLELEQNQIKIATNVSEAAIPAIAGQGKAEEVWMLLTPDPPCITQAVAFDIDNLPGSD